MKKLLLTVSLMGISVAQALALAESGGDTRTQTITCGLQFPGAAQLESIQSVVVQNGEARLIGQSRNYKYGFSVAGKTGLGKITDLQTGYSVVAKGAIEMLSHGGRGAVRQVVSLRKGDDDGQDHIGEREGGFDLAINSDSGNLVTLKCENQKSPKKATAQVSSAGVVFQSEVQDVGVLEVPVVARCKETDYVDVPANSPNFMITTKGSSYTPRCLRIHKGTNLKIEASGMHPLQGIESLAGAAANPIYDELGATSNSKTYLFSNLGVFGYYCVAHGNDRGEGMAGAIWVVE